MNRLAPRLSGWQVGALAGTALAALIAALPTPEPPAQDPGASAVPSRRFVVLDVRLFDGDAVHPRATVWVEDGRVARIATAEGSSTPSVAAALPPADPTAWPIVEGRGRTLLPGLLDAHTHSWGDALERALVFGVTAHLDQFGDPRLGGDPNGASRADLFSAGTLVTSPGGHGTQFRPGIPTLGPGDDAAAFVAARLEEGSRWIKLVIEDGRAVGLPRRLPTLGPAEIRAVVEAAHRRGVLAVAHVHALDAAAMAIDAGVDGLVHTVLDGVPPPALARRAAERGLFVVATLSIAASPTAPGAGPALAGDPRLAPYLTRGEAAQLRGPGLLDRVPGAGAGNGPAATARASVAAFRRAGVPILAGTDAANPGTTWGASLHGELELLVGAGLPPADALAAATSRVADAFRLEGRGRIQVGGAADLLLVDGDPTASIDATRSIVAVWKDGIAIERPLAATIRNPRLAPGDARQDFEVEGEGEGGSEAAELPARWMATTDARMGGASLVELSLAAEPACGSATNRFLQVRGSTRAGFAFPWAGALWNLGDAPMSPVDLGGRSSLRLRTRGGPARVLILAQGLSQPLAQPLEASAAWREQSIDLGALGVPVEAVTAIVVAAGPELGAFAFDVDDVALEAGPGNDTGGH